MQLLYVQSLCVQMLCMQPLCVQPLHVQPLRMQPLCVQPLCVQPLLMHMRVPGSTSWIHRPVSRMCTLEAAHTASPTWATPRHLRPSSDVPIAMGGLNPQARPRWG